MKRKEIIDIRAVCPKCNYDNTAWFFSMHDDIRETLIYHENRYKEHPELYKTKAKHYKKDGVKYVKITVIIDDPWCDCEDREDYEENHHQAYSYEECASCGAPHRSREISGYKDVVRGLYHGYCSSCGQMEELLYK